MFFKPVKKMDGISQAPGENKIRVKLPISKSLDDGIFEEVKAGVADSENLLNEDITKMAGEMKEDLLGIFTDLVEDRTASEASVPVADSRSEDFDEGFTIEFPSITENPDKGPSKDDGVHIAEEIQALVKAIEVMNAEVIKRVEDLETKVAERSREIKEEAKSSFDDAITRANRIHDLAIKRSREIKQVMYEAEVKDLELQKLQLDLLNNCEDQAIEREKKIKDITVGT